MFAGKTSAGIAEFRECYGVGVAFKYALDDRYSSTQVITHDGVSIDATPYSSISDILAVIRGTFCNYVLIDEFQFVPDPERILEIMDLGVNCIVTGLSGTYLAKMFDAMTTIIPIADKIIQHYARCDICASPATYTIRKTNNATLVCIGGEETYSARCRNCLSDRH